MPQDERAGFPTYWTTYGNGPRNALAIHCSLAHSGSWGAMAQHLSDRLSLRAFDVPGHGRSAPWDGRGEIQEVTARIAADLCEGPTDLIGHSFGATVALRLAVMRPDLVRSLVLIEPVFFAAGFADAPEARAEFERDMADYAAAMAQGDRMTAARAFTDLWGNGARWEAIPEVLRNSMAAQMPLIEATEPVLHDDAAGLLDEGVLQAVKVPVLLIEGSESPGIIGHVNAALAARLPDARRAVIAGAGHMAPITHPAQVASEVLRFL